MQCQGLILGPNYTVCNTGTDLATDVTTEEEQEAEANEQGIALTKFNDIIVQLQFVVHSHM